jgi:hypothetical protein
MKITKSKLLEILAALIILLVFNTVFFMLPIVRETRSWISYGFSTLAIILAAATSFYVLWREQSRSKFYGLPILYVSWIYLPVQIVWGFVFMFASAIPQWAGITASVVLLAACLLGLIAVELGPTEIVRLDGAIKEKVFFIKALQTEIEAIAAKAPDESLKKALAEYAEAMRYSDPMSGPQLADMDNALQLRAAALRREVDAGNAEAARSILDESRLLLAERNKQCRLLK